MSFSAYKLSDLRNMQQLLTQCEADGVTNLKIIQQRLHEHIAARSIDAKKTAMAVLPREKRKERSLRRATRPTTVCAACGAPATIELVNISAATNVGEGLRTAIVCMNPDCRHTEYSAKSALEITGGVK